MVFVTGRFMLSLVLLFVLVFFSPVKHCDHLAGEERERAGLCVSRASVYLFCTH